jgi:hypothetical protein
MKYSWTFHSLLASPPKMKKKKKILWKKKVCGWKFQIFWKYYNWGQSCQGTIVVSGWMQARAKAPPKKIKKQIDSVDWPM